MLELEYYYYTILASILMESAGISCCKYIEQVA